MFKLQGIVKLVSPMVQVSEKFAKREFVVTDNSSMYPQDIMFQLTQGEVEILRYQFGTSRNWGGRRYLPYVFTEHGAWMLGNILNSPSATAASIHIVRTFIRLREMIISHTELSRKLSDLEKKYDTQFKVVFDAIQKLMIVPEVPTKKIGI